MSTSDDLEADLEEVRKTPFVQPKYSMQGLWAGYKGGPDAETPDAPTAVPKQRLQELLTRVRIRRVPIVAPRHLPSDTVTS